jgi:hypothetical protein
MPWLATLTLTYSTVLKAFGLTSTKAMDVALALWFANLSWLTFKRPLADVTFL